MNYKGSVDDLVSPLLHFLDKYVSVNIGQRDLDTYYKMHPNKTLLDKITVQDIAYTILVYEDRKDYWDEEHKIKNFDTTAEAKKAYAREARSKYHAQKGQRIPVNRDGWNKAGADYYLELMCTFTRLKSSLLFWEKITNHWLEYVKTNHEVYFERINREVQKNQDDSDEDDDDDCMICLPGDTIEPSQIDFDDGTGEGAG